MVSTSSAAQVWNADVEADWKKDVQRYGPCLEFYRPLTLKENCGFAADRPGGVTLQYAKCLARQMATMNMAYKHGEARKQIIHNGMGGDLDQTRPSSQVRHITQTCKAVMAYACATATSNSSAQDSPQRTACRESSIPAFDVPASLGQESQCPSMVLEMVPRTGNEQLYDAMLALVGELTWGFRDVPDSSFEGGSKAWGAAVAVCHMISQVGTGGPHAGADVLPDSAYTTKGMYGHNPDADLEEEEVIKIRVPVNAGLFTETNDLSSLSKNPEDKGKEGFVFNYEAGDIEYDSTINDRYFFMDTWGKKTATSTGGHFSIKIDYNGKKVKN